MTRLWDVFDGEPFMDNPRLGILYPNKRKKTHKKGRKNMARRKHKGMRQPAALARYWATHRKGRKRNAPRRRRRRSRKNWANTGVLTAVNPKHRKHHRRHHRSNPRRHHRRHHRNPQLLGLYMPPVRTVAFGALGFASPPLVQGFLTSLAPSIMTMATSYGLIGKYAIKIGTIVLTSWAVRRFVSVADGNAVAIGGGVNVALSLVNDFAPGFLPANPLAMYIPTRPGLRAYIPTRPGLRGGQVIPMTPQSTQARNLPSAAPFRDLTTSGPWGTASRYQRY